MESQPPSVHTATGANFSLSFRGQTRRKKPCRCCAICYFSCCMSIFILVHVTLFSLFVVYPLTFKYSTERLRNKVYPGNKLLVHSPSGFKKFANNEIRGARIFQLKLNYTIPTMIEVWHLLPSGLIYDYDLIGDKFLFRDAYSILRTYSHVIAFDYRGYGDSTNDTITEEGIVQDSIQLYYWVRKQTSVYIYFWGHGGGAALATRAVATLHKHYNDRPKGLFLEAPFTSTRDLMIEHPFFGKVFSWLPWYEWTFLNPLDENGLSLNTAFYIKDVKCCIMITHAEDDEVIPLNHSLELVNIVRAHRSWWWKENVTFHRVPARFGCGHFFLFSWPESRRYLGSDIDVCER